MRSSAQLESGVRIGDFQIEKRLGAGGMGIVSKARQVSLDRVVALKALMALGPALKRPADLERFQREAKAAARLKHAGITSIHFIGQDAEVCYHVRLKKATITFIAKGDVHRYYKKGERPEWHEVKS